MKNLPVLAISFSLLSVSGAWAQSGLSNGQQSGVVQSPATPAPGVQQPGGFATSGGAPVGQGVIPPQAPTTFSPAGAPAQLPGGPSAGGTGAP